MMRIAAVSLMLTTACVGDYVDPTLPDPTLVGGVERLTAERGFTLTIQPFAVPPGNEVQDCYFFAVPDINNGEPVWIDAFKLGQRAGSHHLNIFRVNTIKNLGGRAGDVVRGGECRISPNWADWPLVVNSQESSVDEPVFDWQLPDGVAQRFEPGELLMLQSHYVNADLQETPAGGEVRASFYKSATAAPIEMGTLFATQQSIRVCQSTPNPTYQGGCRFPGESPTTLIAANGHYHSRGQQFSVFPWDGISDAEPDPSSAIYVSNDWAEPLMAVDLDVQVPAGGGLLWQCDFEWKEPSVGCDELNARDPLQAGDCCYTFGGIVETSEHCNVFAYYYPKAESDVFCQ